MMTCNKEIYHCLTCGSVVHNEIGVAHPQCCGHAMVKAATETVDRCDCEVPASGSKQPSAAAPAAVETQPKAR